MTTTLPRFDPRLGAAALRAPAASREDSGPQAILKLQPPNSLDYRVLYKPQSFQKVILASCTLLKRYTACSSIAKEQRVLNRQSFRLRNPTVLFNLFNYCDF